MCVECLVNGQEVGSIADLREAIGGVVFFVQCYPVDQLPKANECLCNVDIKATAEAFGFAIDETDDCLFPYSLTGVKRAVPFAGAPICDAEDA